MAPYRESRFKGDWRATLGIRPEYLVVRMTGAEAGMLRGRIDKTRFVGRYQFVFICVSPTLILLAADPLRVCELGENCLVEIDEAKLVMFANPEGSAA